MASTEKRRGSGETVDQPEEVEAVGRPHDQPARMVTDSNHYEIARVEVVELDPHGQRACMVTDSNPYEIARCALDLKFPLEDSESDWSVDDVDDGHVIDGEKETDYPGNKVVDGDDDHDYDVQVITGDRNINCPGKDYTESDAEEIELKWLDSYCKQMRDCSALCDDILAREDEDTPSPPFPLKLLPPVTSLCMLDGYCYHSAYKTHDTSTTASTLGYRRPREMLQFFSMCLSNFEPSYPISVYGIFAVRDNLDQRRNYVFNCPREAAVGIGKQESFDLPLCSPCRGMYVLDRALLEVDLWVKKEGDGSADKHILSAYAEIEVRSDFDAMLSGRISGDDCNLDLGFMILARSVEAVIQVYAKVDHPHHVRITALSSAYADARITALNTDYAHEIVLFDDQLSGNEKLIQHIVAVKKNVNLDVLLRVDESLFQWTFRDEYVGAVSSPGDSILEYGQFFVRVFFAPKNSK